MVASVVVVVEGVVEVTVPTEAEDVGPSSNVTVPDPVGVEVTLTLPLT